jgi:tRNA U34 5-methylaminomethyl-2-thiouridine-forming methyltransferase MnmC
MQIPPNLINEKYNDRYFDVINALDEAKFIYFQGCEILNKILQVESNKEFQIGETGFGAGRILIALLDYLNHSCLKDLIITYNSVELHPIATEKMLSILDRFRPEVGYLIDLLIEEYRKLDISVSGWHQFQLKNKFGVLIVNLWIGEALDMIEALTTPCDAWFLDGHGPKKNPSMWREELLKAVGEKTKSQGTCATYTDAGDVRRGLSSAGFIVERLPGFGGKKSVLKGIKI